MKLNDKLTKFIGITLLALLILLPICAVFFSYYLPIVLLNNNPWYENLIFTLILIILDFYSEIILKALKIDTKSYRNIPIIVLATFICIVLALQIYKINLSTLTIIIVLIIDTAFGFITIYLDKKEERDKEKYNDKEL